LPSFLTGAFFAAGFLAAAFFAGAAFLAAGFFSAFFAAGFLAAGFFAAALGAAFTSALGAAGAATGATVLTSFFSVSILKEPPYFSLFGYTKSTFLYYLCQQTFFRIIFKFYFRLM
jgi:hypothetical protein